MSDGRFCVNSWWKSGQKNEQNLGDGMNIISLYIFYDIYNSGQIMIESP